MVRPTVAKPAPTPKHKLPKPVKKLWLQALRGKSPRGIYVQGQGTLYYTRTLEHFEQSTASAQARIRNHYAKMLNGADISDKRRLPRDGNNQPAVPQFCCLGVLANELWATDLDAEATLCLADIDWWADLPLMSFLPHQEDGEENIPEHPVTIFDRWGLDLEVQKHLANMNDDTSGFEEQIRWIEANL